MPLWFVFWEPIMVRRDFLKHSTLLGFGGTVPTFLGRSALGIRADDRIWRPGVEIAATDPRGRPDLAPTGGNCRPSRAAPPTAARAGLAR